MKKQPVSVWCALWSSGLFEPTTVGEAVKLLWLLKLFGLNRTIYLEGMWFQKNDTTPHPVNVTIQLLNGRVISSKSDVNLPSISSDLTPLEYFFPFTSDL